MPEAPAPGPSEEAKAAASTSYGDLIDSAVREVKGTPEPEVGAPEVAEELAADLPMHETQAKLMADIEAEGIAEASKVKSKAAKEKRIAAARERAEAAAAVFVDRAQANYVKDPEKAETMAYAEKNYRDTAKDFEATGEAGIASALTETAKATGTAAGEQHDAAKAEAAARAAEEKRQLDQAVIAFTANIRQRSETGKGYYSVRDKLDKIPQYLATSFSRSELPYYSTSVRGKGGRFTEIYYNSTTPANSNLAWVERYNAHTGELVSINVIASDKIAKPTGVRERLGGWQGPLVPSKGLERQMQNIRESEASQLGKVGGRIGSSDYRRPDGADLTEYIARRSVGEAGSVPDYLKPRTRRSTAKPRDHWWQLWR